MFNFKDNRNKSFQRLLWFSILGTPVHIASEFSSSLVFFLPTLNTVHSRSLYTKNDTICTSKTGTKENYENVRKLRFWIRALISGFWYKNRVGVFFSYWAIYCVFRRKIMNGIQLAWYRTQQITLTTGAKII